MAAPIAATIAGEIFKRISDLIMPARSYFARDDLRVRYLLAEEDKLIRVDPVAGHVARACTWQLVGDAEMVLDSIRAARSIRPRDPQVFGETTPPLLNLGFFSRALESFRVSADPTGGFFTRYLAHGIGCGAFQQVAAFISRAERMELDFEGVDVRPLLEAAEVLERNGVKDEEIAAQLDCFGELLREEGMFFTGTVPEVHLVREDEFEAVEVVFRVQAAAQPVADLMARVAEKIASRLDAIPQAFVFSLRSA